MSNSGASLPACASSNFPEVPELLVDRLLEPSPSTNSGCQIG